MRSARALSSSAGGAFGGRLATAGGASSPRARRFASMYDERSPSGAIPAGAGAVTAGALGAGAGLVDASRSRAMTGGAERGRGAGCGAGTDAEGDACGAGAGGGDGGGVSAGARYTASAPLASPRSDRSGEGKRTCGSRHIAAMCTSIDSAMATQIVRVTPSRLLRDVSSQSVIECTDSNRSVAAAIINRPLAGC